jgi:hypothetical protein
VVGSDFHSEPPEELKDRGYCSNDQLPENRGRFDLILAMHVLEHDNDPAKILGKLRILGIKECTFVIEVPNADCIWARAFGQHWDAWYLPFHRIHFSRTSLRGTLTRNGFVILREIDVTIPSIGRSLSNVFQKNGIAFLFVGAVLYPLQWLVERASRSPSALRMIARLKI